MSGQDETSVSFGVFEILLTAIEVLYRNLFRFGVVAVIVFAPTALMGSGTIGFGASGSPTVMFSWKTVAWVGMCSLATAAFAHGTLLDLSGRTFRLRDFVGKSASNVLIALGVVILNVIALMISPLGLGAILAIIFLNGALTSPIWVTIGIAGFMMSAIPSFILYLFWWVLIPVFVIERPGIRGAFKRSRKLTKGRRWKILGLTVLIAVMTGIIGLILEGVFSDPGTGSANYLFRALYLAQSAFFGTLSAIAATIGYQILKSEKGGIASDTASVFD